MIARFDLAPVRDDEVEGLRGLSAREIMARLNVSMWQLPAIVRDMRKRKLAAASEISLFDGVPAMLADLQRLGIKTAIVSSDSEASVRAGSRTLRRLIARFDCGASMFGKHWKFRRVARQLDANPSETICIGDELRDIDAGQGRRHGFRRGRLGLCASGRVAGGGADASLQFDRRDDAAAHDDETTVRARPRVLLLLGQHQ